mmetsp:Transcript_10360/g.26535  ORF Transcript_10360/g.26535 Transcript_10360/m.26535 type:complete len:656 (+) Transcript_10360:141-2108(+)
MAFRPVARGITPRRPFQDNTWLTNGARIGGSDGKARLAELKAEKERRKRLAKARMGMGGTPTLPEVSFRVAAGGDHAVIDFGAEDGPAMLCGRKRCDSTKSIDDGVALSSFGDEGEEAAPEAPEATPVKDLAGIFADDEKTSTLADMMAQMHVKTPRASATAAASIGPRRVNLVVPATPTLSPTPGTTNAVAPEKDAAYFRAISTAEATTLEEASLHWTKIAEDESLDEGLRGEIRAAVGQALLLQRKRVSQFLDLCDLCDFGPEDDGLTASAADLDGFWDVIMMQVNDVKKMFSRLETRQKAGWKCEIKKCNAPKKTRRGEKLKGRGPAKKGARGKGKAGRRGGKMPPTPRRKAAQARLTAAKALLKAKAKEGALPVQASLAVLTPVRATKAERRIHGTSFLVTPVRRSSRKTPSKYRKSPEDVTAVLTTAEFAYKPNYALNPLSAEINSAAVAAVSPMGVIDHEDDLTSPGPTSCSPLAPVAEISPVDIARIEEEVDDVSDGEYDDGRALAAASASLKALSVGTPGRGIGLPRRVSVGTPAAAMAPLRVPYSPAVGMDRPVAESAVGLSRAAKREAVDPACGSVKRFAAVVAPRRLQAELGADIVFTPVRRSRRLSAAVHGTPAAAPCIENATDMPEGAAYVPNPAVDGMFRS